ncbi:hypothetical protein CYV15_01445 [Riemerella anatipestifer]|nr:hypothetical protein CYV15_01445 [Riemerella anatipestifer]
MLRGSFYEPHFCIKIMILFIAGFSLISCSSTFFLRNAGVLDERVNLQEIDYKGKKVVFLGIRHIGTKSYYLNIKTVIDSLKKEEYLFLLEGLNKDGSKEDSIVFYDKKMRKILGVGVSSKYIDTLNYKILGKISYSPELNLIDQPSYEKLGIKNTYIVSDTNSKILVKEFEKKYGEILLDKCDLETEIAQIYTCNTLSRKQRKYFVEDFVQDFRNRIVVDDIDSVSSTKICVIYGERHIEKIKNILKQNSK